MLLGVGGKNGRKLFERASPRCYSRSSASTAFGIDVFGEGVDASRGTDSIKVALRLIRLLVSVGTM